MSDLSPDITLNISSTYNCTPDPTSKFVNLDPLFMTYYYGIFGLTLLVNLTGNWLVLRTMYRHRCLWLPCNAFICSLAVSDFIYGLVYAVYNVAGINRPVVTDILGPWTVCRIVMAEAIALEICSVYALVAITITRYVCIAFPLRYSQYVTPRNCLIVIVVLWVVSHVACIVFYALQVPHAVQTGVYCKVCRFEKIYTMRELYVLTTVQFGSPFALMLTFYLRMACIASKLNSRVVSESFSPGSVQSPSTSNHRYQRSFVITLLIGCFFMSYLPMIIYCFIVIAMGKPKGHLEYFSATSRIFLFLNTAVNLFIYAGRMPDFRDCLRRDIASVRLCSCCYSATSSVTSRSWTTGNRRLVARASVSSVQTVQHTVQPDTFVRPLPAHLALSAHLPL